MRAPGRAQWDSSLVQDSPPGDVLNRLCITRLGAYVISAGEHHDHLRTHFDRIGFLV